MKLPIETIIETIESLKHESRYHEAKETALSALTRHTDDYRLYEELADIYLFEQNLEKAEEVISYARELHPSSGTGIYLEGFIAVIKGDFDKAIQVLGEANSILPNNAEVIRNLGWAYVMKGHVDRGIALLKRAHALAPEDTTVINDLAMALMANGSEEEAQILFEKIGNTATYDAMKTMEK